MSVMMSNLERHIDFIIQALHIKPLDFVLGLLGNVGEDGTTEASEASR
jgi:hypothetical protein